MHSHVYAHGNKCQGNSLSATLFKLKNELEKFHDSMKTTKRILLILKLMNKSLMFTIVSFPPVKTYNKQKITK